MQKSLNKPRIMVNADAEGVEQIEVGGTDNDVVDTHLVIYTNPGQQKVNREANFCASLHILNLVSHGKLPFWPKV